MLKKSPRQLALPERAAAALAGLASTLMIHRTQRGGLSSPASQPMASVLRGSTGKQMMSVRWQVLHSKVRCSSPRSPGEILASPILCLQEGHIGRSTMELRITHHQKNDMW
jgi:hypothetical protein